MTAARIPHWPAPLQPGDLVAIPAPASPVRREPFLQGLRWLQEWGLQVRYGEDIFRDRPWEKEADRRLADRLMELMADPQVRGIICARGGYGTLKILEHLDFALLAHHPKFFVGFSDVSNLLWTLGQRVHLVTFHGPNVAHLGEVTAAARESLRQILTESRESYRQQFTGLQVLCPGQGAGPLCGGNLTTLCHLVGTPFFPTLEGQVLFLEDHGEAAYRIDRMLHHLRLAGVLAGLQGIVLGSFTGGGDPEQVAEICRVALLPLGLPVLAGLPAGHQPDNHTLPLGAWAVVDATGGSLELRRQA